MNPLEALNTLSSVIAQIDLKRKPMLHLMACEQCIRGALTQAMAPDTPPKAGPTAVVPTDSE